MNVSGIGGTQSGTEQSNFSDRRNPPRSVLQPTGSGGLSGQLAGVPQHRQRRMSEDSRRVVLDPFFNGVDSATVARRVSHFRTPEGQREVRAMGLLEWRRLSPYPVGDNAQPYVAADVDNVRAEQQPPRPPETGELRQPPSTHEQWNRLLAERQQLIAN